MRIENYKMKLYLSFLIVVCCIIKMSFTSFADEVNSDFTYNSVVEVESYYIEEGYIEAGKEATINMTVHNANKYSTVNSLVAIFSSESGMIYPTYGNDNEIVLGKLEPNESTTVSFPVVVNSEFTGDQIDFSCEFVYETSGKLITNSSTMMLPSQTKSSITVNSVDVSAHAYLNSKSLLSVNYTNNSEVNINDAVLVVNGAVGESSQNIELGTVLAGKSYIKDYNIVFVQPGVQTIEIKFRYTNVDGKPMELELGTYDINVDEEKYSEFSVKNENTTLSWIGNMIAVVSGLCVAIVVAVYIKKR